MVDTITPVVHGGSTKRYARTVAIHVAAATVTAALVGAFAGGLGALLPAGRWPLVSMLVACAIAYACAELSPLRLPLLERHAQVPEWWRTFFRPDVAAALYGAGLGVGFATYIRHGTFFVVTLAALLVADPLWGAVMCAPFGLARAMTVLRTRASRDQEGVDACIARIEGRAGGLRERALNAAALAAVGAAALL
ncbi:MAG TPA: hypothetical protein VNC78_01760 [Actinomycetota bacterium]|nr:hypothetical protein [Actinomycetota bacterium]